jgi:hypothetical protein
MLYQLSYASVVKPSKNSRRGIRIARTGLYFSSTPTTSLVEKTPYFLP